MRPQDTKAEAITFGVELETTIPAAAGIVVGPYHGGLPVADGVATATGQRVAAPHFGGTRWHADQDGSIRSEGGRAACEFVSPVLSGAEGVEALLAFVDWAKAVGATVNSSCGCHITVGVASVIGTSDPQAVGEFARKLAHLAHWHARALYGQTGTGRHLNTYSRPFDAAVGALARRMLRRPLPADKDRAARSCGRGMVNFGKLFTHGVVEFRVFAGTLNQQKLMHHLATVLGLCRRAAEVECLGGFGRNKAQAKRTATAAEALRFLRDYLGWTGSKRPVALGLFGALYDGFGAYAPVAERMCARFDACFPAANL